MSDHSLYPIIAINRIEKKLWNIPDNSIISKIPLIKTILKQIIRNWEKETKLCNSHQKNANSDEDTLVLFFSKFQAASSRYILCLFSYVTFFCMLEGGYKQIYAELNGLNRTLNLKMKHDKPPKHTTLIEDLWLIRHKSIAHWAEAEHNDLNSVAGRCWNLFCNINESETPSAGIGQMGLYFPQVSRLDKGTLKQSKKCETKTIKEINEECFQYINQYEDVCVKYLTKLKSKLPKESNNIEYSTLEIIENKK